MMSNEIFINNYHNYDNYDNYDTDSGYYSE